MLNRLKDLFQAKSESCRVGLLVQAEAVSLCVLSEDGSRLIASDRAESTTNSLPEILSMWVSEYGLQHAPLNVTLGNGWYELQQVERPNVPDEELNQALVWSMRELVPIPQKNLLVDYFDLPVQPAGGNKVNVICADRERLRGLVNAVLDASLNLVDISIEELSLSRLIEQVDEAELMLFQKRGDDLHLAIFKQNRLYFSRKLRGYKGLPDYLETDFENGVADNLSLEIQRSMDLFESQLRQAPVKAIRIAIDSPHRDKLVELISVNFFQTVSSFRCHLADSDEASVELLPAVGAALPLEEVA